MLHTWAKWYIVRQVIGLIALAIFIYTYSKTEAVRLKKLIRSDSSRSKSEIILI